MGSWKTTVCGVCGIVAAIAVGVKAVLDGDPNTSIDIGSIVTAIAVLAPSIAAIFARDNDKSSEDVGVK
jgi:hypothetical protein